MEFRISSSTMGVEMIKRRKNAGQSILEFAFLIPIFAAILFLVVEVETAISMSIVSQKYARNHMHFLFFNHRQYPQHDFIRRSNGDLMKRWWIGVDDNSTYNKINNIIPKAPTQKVGKIKPSQDEQPGDVDERQNVRIRTMVFTCLPPYGDKSGFFSEQNLGENIFLTGGYRYCEE